MMPRVRKYMWPLTWLMAVVLVEIYGGLGGDEMVESAFLFLILTAPFGVVIYESPSIIKFENMWLPVEIQVWLNFSMSVVLAFIFWFVLLPRIKRKADAWYARVRQR